MCGLHSVDGIANVTFKLFPSFIIMTAVGLLIGKQYNAIIIKKKKIILYWGVFFSEIYLNQGANYSMNCYMFAGYVFSFMFGKLMPRLIHYHNTSLCYECLRSALTSVPFEIECEYSKLDFCKYNHIRLPEILTGQKMLNVIPLCSKS